MEGGEWSSFNGVYVNEEADFMAQLFSTTDELETCYRRGSGVANDPIVGHENYYVCDNSNSFLADNNNNSMFEICDDKLEESGEIELSDNKHCLAKRGSEMSLELDDKISNCSDISRKHARISVVRKGIRNATRSKKKQKAGVVEEDNNGGISKQTFSSCSSEDESNLSLELNNGASLSGKTRASRGSATDPQSLYARKRRERINERLKVLQNLVPNGTKVDISTMLEEAVEYVKFLQLQIKLLSSDDLWMYAPIAYNGMDIGLNLKINASK